MMISTDIPQTTPTPFGAIPAKFLSRKASAAHSWTSAFLKRTIDLIISLSLVTIFAPLFAFLIVLVSSDGGPAFYAQRRVGRDGRIFRCWKFRTMVVEADTKL